MKYSTKVSDAVHILIFIAEYKDGPLTSNKIAESIKGNPSCVRQLMSKLRTANIINSIPGHPRPTLSKDASEITLLDVYKAVEGDKQLLHLDTHTNPECGIGMNIQYALQDFYNIVQKDAEQSMAGITLQSIIDRFHEMCH